MEQYFLSSIGDNPVRSSFEIRMSHSHLTILVNFSRHASF